MQGESNAKQTTTTETRRGDGSGVARAVEVQRRARVRADPRRLARSSFGAEVRNADVDPACDAQGRDDPQSDGQAHRLLRDFDATVCPADPDGWSSADDGVGLRRCQVRSE